MKLRDVLGVLRDSYCRRVGVEYMHITDPEEREWIQKHIEVKHTCESGRAEAHTRPGSMSPSIRDLPADEIRRADPVFPRGAETSIAVLDAVLRRSAQLAWTRP